MQHGTWLLAILMAIIAITAVPGCDKVSSPRVGIELQSGLDKKSSAAGDDLTAEVSSPTGGSAYDSQIRQATNSSAEAADSKSGKRNPSAPGQFSATTLERIGTWFNPVAYADDTHIDEKYLVRSGDVSVNVEDFDKSVQAVYSIATKFGGIVTDSQIDNSGDNNRSGTITLRVPNTRFFDVFTALGKVGTIASQNITSEDVSHEYVAAISRLQNLTLEQDTLRKMLDQALAVQRARGLGEGYSILLDTQQRLSEVTGKIQDTEDQISQLADKITRSTIKVELSQQPKYVPEQFTWGMGATFDESKKQLLSILRGLGQGAIHFAVVGWLTLLPWLLFFWLGYKAYRRYLVPHMLAEKAATSAAGES